MLHRQPDTSFRGLGALSAERLQQATEQRRVIAIGRCTNGGAFRVVAPADWPTEEEIAAICAPNKYDLMAKAIVMLMDPADYELYSKFAEREAELLQD